MAFQVSPGVSIREIDLTTVVPAVSTTEGAIAGHFQWGPVKKRILVSSEDVLKDTFGKPNANTAVDFFSAANFLSYGNALYVVRTEAADANNASAAGLGRYVKNDDDYEDNFSSGVTGAGNWVAKYPGVLGNSLKVSICQGANTWESNLSANLQFTAGSNTVLSNVNLASQIVAGDLLIAANSGTTINLKVASIAANGTSITLTNSPKQDDLGAASIWTNNTGSGQVKRRWEYFNNFFSVPGTSDYATKASGANDELHVVVVDKDGEWTGVQGQVLERFEKVSRASDAKSENGTNNYYKEVVNNQSRFLWWAGHDAFMTNAGGLASVTYTNTDDRAQTDSLSGGTTGTPPTNGQKISAYDLFSNPEDVDISFIVGSDADATVATYLIQNIAESRLDCVAVISPERADVVNNASYTGKETEDVNEFRDTLPASSYGFMDSSWKYMYDKYNDVYRYVPFNGDTAGLMVRTDLTRDPWYSPAGYQRGRYKGVVKLPYNPNKAQRDLLYKKSVNPVISQPGQGVLLFGDKTMLLQPSAFSRINVRRLFIVLEKAIATAAKFSLFEFNDAFTRSQFKNMVEPFLREVKGRRGIIDFRVVADETNNTAQVIQNNEFVGDIYIKPNYAINFINLSFIAVGNQATFEEIVGQF